MLTISLPSAKKFPNTKAHVYCTDRPSLTFHQCTLHLSQCINIKILTVKLWFDEFGPTHTYSTFYLTAKPRWHHGVKLMYVLSLQVSSSNILQKLLLWTLFLYSLHFLFDVISVVAWSHWLNSLLTNWYQNTSCKCSDQ